MKKIAGYLTLVLLTACSGRTLALVRPPGTTLQAARKDVYECQREAYSALPPQRGEAPRYIAPGGSSAGDSFSGAFTESYYRSLARQDLNAGARNDYFDSCISARGYVLMDEEEAGKIREEQKRECETQGGSWNADDVTCRSAPAEGS